MDCVGGIQIVLKIRKRKLERYFKGPTNPDVSHIHTLELLFVQNVMSPNTREKEVKNSSQDLHETKFDLSVHAWLDCWQWYDFFHKVTFFDWHRYHFFYCFILTLTFILKPLTFPVSCEQNFSKQQSRIQWTKHICIVRTQGQVGLGLETANLNHGSSSS